MSEELKIGAKLKQVREDKGKSLEQASQHTKIQINILSAIEEDRMDNFSLVHTKGFLKLYAQYLGLDPQEIINEYQAQLKSKGSPVEDKTSLKSPSGPDLGMDWTYLLPRFKLGVQIVLILLVIIGLGKLISVSRTKKPVYPIVPQAKTEETAVTPLPASKKTAKKPVQKKADPVKLAIMAKATSWVQVYIDGKKIFEGILKKGMKESWDADKEIKLSVGNAGGVELEVNDEILLSLGRRGQVLKDIVITSDGISTPGGFR